MRFPKALALALIAFAAIGCGPKGPSKAELRSPLFTGTEPKRSIELTLPASQKIGFVGLKRQIYATGSLVNQGKQILQALLDGPARDGSEAAAVACFGPAAVYNELYLDGKGLAVVDLPAATVAALPGGTSAEVATLFCLVKTLSANLPGVVRVQVLIDGAEAESLRGHVDTLDPLSLSNF